MQKDKLFPAQEKSEKILLVIRRHWFTYVIFWFVAGIMLVPLVIGAIFWVNNLGNLDNSINSLILLGASAYLLFGLGLQVYGFIDYYLDVYIVTDRRIVDIKQNGFFKRSISELNLRQVQDVNASVNGIFSTLLHYGNVYIQTAGEQENFIFESIPHPYETSKKIIDLHEQYLKSIEQNGEEINKIMEDETVDKFYSKARVLNSENEKRLLEGIERNIKEMKKTE